MAVRQAGRSAKIEQMSSWALGGLDSEDEHDPTASANIMAPATGLKLVIHCSIFIIPARISENRPVWEHVFYSNSASTTGIATTDSKVEITTVPATVSGFV